MAESQSNINTQATVSHRIRKTSKLSHQLSTPLAILALLVGWEILGRISNAVFFPPFSKVIQTWFVLVRTGVLGSALTTSLLSLFLGYGIAVVMGILIGTAMGLSPTIRYFLDIYVNTLMAAPLIALIPIIAIFLGLEVSARTAVVFLFSFFVVTLNTEAGMQAAEPDIKEMARSFGLNKLQVFLKVIFPAAIPAVLAGLRLGIVRAVKGMVTAEMFMALTGMGALLENYGSQFRANELFAVLLTVIILSMVVGTLISQLDKRLTRWQRDVSES